MEESNFKDQLDEEEITMVKETVSDLIDSLVALNRESFTAADVRDLIGECDWTGKILFSILFANGELCGCEDGHDHDDED